MQEVNYIRIMQNPAEYARAIADKYNKPTFQIALLVENAYFK